MEITQAVAEKLLLVVDAGLVSGLGINEPGKMCVEAAVCYALGLEHGDNPPCVAPVLRSLKIRLNDSRWPTPQARAKGMRRLALIQLGSKHNLNHNEFIQKLKASSAVAAAYVAAYVAAAASAAADAYAVAAADAYAYAADADAAAASAAADAAYDAAAASDKILAKFAEDVVQILIEMKVPGVQWLFLTE